MAEYKLHCFAQSGNAYKVALMLELAGADWEPVWVDFFHGATRTPEYLELNEMGEVPVLEHGELGSASPASSSTTSRSATATSRRSPRRSAARCCAGRSGTTTSSPARSRRCAT